MTRPEQEIILTDMIHAVSIYFINMLLVGRNDIGNNVIFPSFC